MDEKILWIFDRTDGAGPLAGLIADRGGNLLGTTIEGGACTSPTGFLCGTVFELSPPSRQQPQWTEKVLGNFGVVANDGERPQASLIADNWGNLYGTTSQGGANTCSSDGPGCGTVFERSPPSPQQPQWTEKVLWGFHGVDGEGPSAGLIADGQGNFYGTTSAGGTIQSTAFELSRRVASRLDGARRCCGTSADQVTDVFLLPPCSRIAGAISMERRWPGPTVPMEAPCLS